MSDKPIYLPAYWPSAFGYPIGYSISTSRCSSTLYFPMCFSNNSQGPTQLLMTKTLLSYLIYLSIFFSITITRQYLTCHIIIFSKLLSEKRRSIKKDFCGMLGNLLCRHNILPNPYNVGQLNIRGIIIFSTGWRDVPFLFHWFETIFQWL